MRRLSIQLKVTLWFTLLMVLLVSIVLVFLFSLGAQSALEGTKSQMMDMVAAAWHEIGSDDGAIEIDDDLNTSRTAFIFRFTMRAACHCMELCPGTLTIQRFSLPTICGRFPPEGKAGMYMTSRNRCMDTEQCGFAV
ncbi:MAG: hypothetical protein ACLS8R_06485 [Anaeromassilibacillus sp.]